MVAHALSARPSGISQVGLDTANPVFNPDQQACPGPQDVEFWEHVRDTSPTSM